MGVLKSYFIKYSIIGAKPCGVILFLHKHDGATARGCRGLIDSIFQKSLNHFLHYLPFIKGHTTLVLFNLGVIARENLILYNSSAPSLRHFGVS